MAENKETVMQANEDAEKIRAAEEAKQVEIEKEELMNFSLKFNCFKSKVITFLFLIIGNLSVFPMVFTVFIFIFPSP